MIRFLIIRVGTLAFGLLLTSVVIFISLRVLPGE